MEITPVPRFKILVSASVLELAKSNITYQQYQRHRQYQNTTIMSIS